MTMVAGRDEGEHAGIQNNPVLGAILPPIDILADDEAVRDYVNSVGDEQFWAFQARTLAHYGINSVPLTFFDREIGAKLVGISARFALHAKQRFRFRGVVEVGRTYRLTGEVSALTEKRGIDYFTTYSTCCPIDGPDLLLLESWYTRAFRFPDNQYVRNRSREKVSLSRWLFDNQAMPRRRFPEVGSIIEGRTSSMDQAKINLYSGPGSSVHTDNLVARRGGLTGTVGQGLMATELECELYRDLFGLAFFKRGDVEVSYVDPIPSGCSLRATAVVTEVDDSRITLQSAVATTTGEIVSLGRVAVSNWTTEQDVV
jgi:acyl dehydratase